MNKSFIKLLSVAFILPIILVACKKTPGCEPATPDDDPLVDVVVFMHWDYSVRVIKKSIFDAAPIMKDVAP